MCVLAKPRLSSPRSSYLSAGLCGRRLLALGPALLLRGLSRLRRGCSRRRPAPLPVRCPADVVPPAADDVDDVREVLGDGAGQLAEQLQEGRAGWRGTSEDH